MMRASVAVYDPAGVAIVGGVSASNTSTRKARKALRAYMARKTGIKWRDLWLQGYRVKEIQH